MKQKNGRLWEEATLRYDSDQDVTAEDSENIMQDIQQLGRSSNMGLQNRKPSTVAKNNLNI
jgi:hypothetical protein